MRAFQLRTIIAGLQESGRRSADRAGFLVASAMCLTIAGTLFGTPAIALSSMAILCIVIVSMATSRPVEAATVLFAYLAMEGMYKYLTHFSPIVYVARPALIVILFFLHFRNSGPKFSLTAMPPMTVPLCVFLMLAMVCIFHPYGNGVISGTATFLMFYGTPIALYFVGYRCVTLGRQVLLFAVVLLAICTVVSAFTALQFTKGMEWTVAHLPGYDSMPIEAAGWFKIDDAGEVTTGFRPASTTGAGGGGGGWSGLGVITAVGLLRLSRSHGRRLLLGICLGANGIGLLLSGVRVHSFVAAFGVIVFFCASAQTAEDFSKALRLSIAVVLLSAMAYWGALQLSAGTIAARYSDTFVNPVGRYSKERGNNLGALADIALKYPFGVGYQMGMGYKKTEAGDMGKSAPSMLNRETQFAALVGDVGLPGLLLMTPIFFVCMVHGWRACRGLRDPDLRILGSMLLASIAGYLPSWFGGPAIQGNVHFWFVAGILIALPRVELRQRALIARLIASSSPATISQPAEFSPASAVRETTE